MNLISPGRGEQWNEKCDSFSPVTFFLSILLEHLQPDHHENDHQWQTSIIQCCLLAMTLAWCDRRGSGFSRRPTQAIYQTWSGLSQGDTRCALNASWDPKKWNQTWPLSSGQGSFMLTSTRRGHHLLSPAPFRDSKTSISVPAHTSCYQICIHGQVVTCFKGWKQNKIQKKLE